MAAAHRHRNRSASHHFAIRESRLRRESVTPIQRGSWMSNMAGADMVFACRWLIIPGYY
jgi:hypothetical protein